MKNRLIRSLLVLILFISFPPLALANSPASSSNESSVPSNSAKQKKTYEVKFPSFKIMINNIHLNNGILRYPVLIYEGVTYFPMTWGFTQALGLDVRWDSEKGFAINKSNQAPKKLANEVAIISARHLYAKLPDFSIRVNNNEIDNDKEEYPILVFNDVTYFPMTWRFAVEELGLKISLENNKFSISK
ncbi:copper amine oxidase N-terminal domain-containing protein [Paenibacillus radicis (ex Xue et al. 2023)]|uniref:Copper amine oxidase N-terminal domain-containing protein n=1 Tax=Paenibacillus radicis (ex Xue et al. 2023) TaxID=2972489 RepID=A0ABT1YMK3_9BACL|nr:copper amine oxidase N-terminal domain-containing protein [Paenibacillus radicis (ex Xue et al. 2023)]MCR8634406.1 copper amine oxidase N-terminal domain-containing protein [Paenibacillus radicis (ex Xue et al. 2023)]